MGDGSHPADDYMSENENTPFVGFVSANHSFLNSTYSRPGVPSGDTAFPAAFTNNNNSNNECIQPIFSFGPPPSNPSAPRFGDSIRMSSSSSSSPSLFADVAKPHFGDSTRKMTSSSSSSLFVDVPKSLFGESPKITSSPSPSLFADVAKPRFVESTRTTSSSPFPSLFADVAKPLFGESTKTTSSSSIPSLFADETKPFQFNNPFNSTTTPSSLVHVCYNCGYKSFWGQHWGSKVATYTPTPTLDDASSSYFSISAMPFYEDKSHEELRFEDYRFQAKKQKLVNAPVNESAPFGQTLNNIPVNESAPFGQPMPSLPVLMLPVAMLPRTANFRP